MPRKNRRGNRRGRKGRNAPSGILNPKLMSQRTVRIPFRAFTQQSSTTSSTSANVSEINMVIANLGSRVVNAGDIFTQWRIHSLEFESMANQGNNGGSDSTCIHAIGYTPTNPASYSIVTAFSQMVDLPAFAYGNAFNHIKIKVPPSLLRSIPEVWLNTSSAGTGELQSAGTFTFYLQNTTSQTTVSWTQNIVVSGILEFRGAIDTANVPLETLGSRIKYLQNLYDERVALEFVDAKEEEKSGQGKFSRLDKPNLVREHSISSVSTNPPRRV
jgi:hypothetical protein